MQMISSLPLPNWCSLYPFENRSHFINNHFNLTKDLNFNHSLLTTPQSHFRLFTSVSQTHSCSQNHHHCDDTTTETDPLHNHQLILQFFAHSRSETTDNENPEAQNREEEEGGEGKGDEDRGGLLSNMLWADLKAAVGQRFNSGAIVCFVGVIVKDRHLALPHVSVPDIRHVDWAELRRVGFKGVVFDKDNTITAPYSLRLWGPLAPSLEQCKSVFGPNIAVFSNSAGLYEYDHDGSKARALEGAIKIKVIRHSVKKPAGGAQEIENHFGCDSSQLIMVGDRPLTDIVYGNMNGFLTILTEPLSLAEEPLIVRLVRKLESTIVKRWSRRGLKPTPNSLLPDPKQCVIDPPIV